MRKILLVSFLFPLLTLAACSSNGIPRSPDDIPATKLDFSPVEPVEWTMSNGIKVLYIHDDELPLIRGVAVFRGGSLQEAPGQEGLAAITGSQMREGATQDFSPEELDELLDNLGASIESSFGSEWGSVSFSSLSDDLDQVLTIYAEVIRRPAFDSSRLALAKHLVAQEIVRRRDDPGTMASMSFASMVYGPNSPYSQSATMKSIASISRGDMQAFHKRFVHPQNTIIAAAGSIPIEELKRQLESKFGDWTRSDKFVPPVLPEVGDSLKPGVYVLPREFEQATIMIGHRGPVRLGPEHYQLALYNRIFGHGGFSSVLFKEVRSKRGLAYSVWGGFYPGAKSGVFEIDSGTRVTQALETIKTILDLVEKSREEQFTKDQIEDAVIGEGRRFVFNFETSRETVGRRAWLDVMDYPRDYDQKFLSRLGEVKADEILNFAKDNIDLDNLVIVIVGDISPQEVAKFFDGKRPVYQLDFDTEPHLVGPVRTASVM
ncbi:MAG: insulinase family protein [Bdellovibrionales bacterium]|nr:insulinase family protein [Bdellovibrionales bacterium]